MECGRNQSAAENKNAIATKVKMSWSSCRGPPITKPFNSLLDAGNRLATAPRFWATCTSHLVGKAPTTAISEVCREPHPVSRDSRCQFLRPWRMPRSRQVHCCEFCRLVSPLTKMSSDLHLHAYQKVATRWRYGGFDLVAYLSQRPSLHRQSDNSSVISDSMRHKPQGLAFPESAQPINITKRV